MSQDQQFLIQSRAQTSKLIINEFYTKFHKEYIDRQQRQNPFFVFIRQELYKERINIKDISTFQINEKINGFKKQENAYLRNLRVKLEESDFKTLSIIGKGAFGQVKLVQKKNDGLYFAMKILKKNEMIEKNQVRHVKSEREILVQSSYTPWVVRLFYAFQDQMNLYLVLEFVAGGDLMTLLIEKDTFPEDEARFYIAEIFCAVNAIHEMGCIHRDIKPDNLLIDNKGHIKLTDFGLSTGYHRETTQEQYHRRFHSDDIQPPVNPSSVDPLARNEIVSKWKSNRKVIAYSTVGTPDYIAPEVFKSQGYGKECDIWSIGAILYECLIGYAPFCSHTPQETYYKILNYQNYVPNAFPRGKPISDEAKHLIMKLLTDSKKRLTFATVSKHLFFKHFSWENIREMVPPFIPDLSSGDDVSRFPTEELENVMVEIPKIESESDKSGDWNFVGFTYKRYGTL